MIPSLHQGPQEEGAGGKLYPGQGSKWGPRKGCRNVPRFLLAGLIESERWRPSWPGLPGIDLVSASGSPVDLGSGDFSDCCQPRSALFHFLSALFGQRFKRNFAPPDKNSCWRPCLDLPWLLSSQTWYSRICAGLLISSTEFKDPYCSTLKPLTICLLLHGNCQEVATSRREG